jgi:membrane protein insertase Oxa1/YidC/SpoIIIJ
VATYFVQQRQITARNKNNPTVNDSPAAAQQQMIMKIFPIFSGVFAFIVPAALAWYFLVQNVFRIGQQAYITKRFYKEHPDAIVARQAASSKGATSKGAPNAKNTAKPAPKGGRNAAAKATTTPPAKAVEPKGKAKPTPTPSSNGKRREAPKPPPRPTGSTPTPPARPRPQQKKKP